MFESLRNADILTKGGFVALFGLVGVFLVLVLVYLIIRLFALLERRSSPPSADPDGR